MARFNTLHDPGAAAAHRAAGYWPDRLIVDALDHFARVAPDRTVFVDAHGRIDFRSLQRQSYRLAACFAARGLRKGDVVAVQLPNRIEFCVLHLALVRIGAIIALITPMSREREVQSMLRIAQARWFVVADSFRGFDHLALAVAMQQSVPGLERVIVTGSPGATGAEALEALLDSQTDDANARARIDALRPHPDDPSEIVFTSGSTSEPKGVLHSENTLFAPQLAMARSLRLREGAVLHMASTIAHQTGFLNGIRLPIQIGGMCVMQEIWEPTAFPALVEEHRIEASSGSATFLLDILRRADLAAHDVSSLRIFRAGGGPIPIALVREAEARLPGLKVLRGWGQTENGVVTMTRLDDPIEVRATTDGCGQAGMQVRVVDAGDQPVAPGAEGHLQCRGASQFLGYANSIDLTRDAYLDDWFRTGDLATMNAEGYIRITGRARDIIIRGGENIPVSYVENAIFEHPDVLEVAIVGMPDPRLGERACAFVLCRDGRSLTLDTLRTFLSGKGIATQYWPERLIVEQSLPRTSNGKVRKGDLRDRLRAEAGS